MVVGFQPKRTLAECKAILTSPGMPHEIEQVIIDGRVMNAYKHIEPNLRTFWLNSSSAHPERDYIVFENERYTYQQTLDASKDTANSLKEIYGIGKGDRVAVIMMNSPEFIIALWSCALLGSVPTMVNPWLTNEQLLHSVNLTKCKVHIVDAERADRFEALDWADVNSGFIVVRPHEGKGSWKNMKNWNDVFTGSRVSSESWKQEPACGLDDDCAILFTSGTTSMPKAVLSTNRAFISTQMNSRYFFMHAILRREGSLPVRNENAPQTSTLVSAPFFHSAGLTSTLMLHTRNNNKLNLLKKWNVDKAVELIKKENINMLFVMPAMMSDLLQRSSELWKQVQTITTGGSPVAASYPAEMAKKFPKSLFSQGYGLTETNAITTMIVGLEQLARPESSGLPVPICDLLIVDPENGKVMPTGQNGELWIRGSNLFRCYLNDPFGTEKAFTSDGWFKSGDIGYIDEEGFFYLKDRYKDIIIRGGENIHSTTVENALYEHPEIIDAAVVSVPDHRLGELVAAVVKLESGSKLTEQDIIAFTKTKLLWFAVPVIVLIRDTPLERNAAGKLLKTELRTAVRAVWERRQQREKNGKL